MTGQAEVFEEEDMEFESEEYKQLEQELAMVCAIK